MVIIAANRRSAPKGEVLAGALKDHSLVDSERGEVRRCKQVDPSRLEVSGCALHKSQVKGVCGVHG